MAITLNSFPNPYQSFHEDLWFVVTSTNIAQPNFKYVFDVYVGATLVARIKSFPQPTTNKGLFNAAAIIRNYWSSYFFPFQTLFAYIGSDIRVNYVVKFGEEYNNTLYTNLAEQDCDACNYYPSLFDGQTAYTGGWYDNYRALPLTNRDTLNITTARTGTSTFVSLFNADLNTANDWRFEVTRSNNGVITTDSSAGNIEVYDYAMLNVSPYAVNDYLGIEFITAATDFYLLDAYLNEGAQWTMRVNILCDSQYQNIPITFLNSLGGYDTINFSLVNRQSRSIEKKSYEEIDWQYRTNTMSRFNQYGIANGGSKQFSTAQTISYKLVSDWLSLTDYNWIKELIASPEVYMHSAGNYLPIAIQTSTWAEKKRYADKMYNLELDVQFGSKEYSQFR